MNDIANRYDQVPYQSLSVPYTHPDRLATVATLLGLQPAPVERCRVLELGCASGGNIVPMAAQLTSSTFLGVDLSQRQVAAGRKTLADLGLTNVELLHTDLRDLGSDVGPFDYIITHGVYSWVEPAIRDALLSLVKASLAEQGVAYISYNTLPGWHLRSIVRDAMRFHGEAFSDPAQQVEQGRAMMGFLACHAVKDQPYGELLRREQAFLSDFGDDYLFHEYLETHNEPVYFHQFVAHARHHGLTHLADADPMEMSDQRVPDEVRPFLLEIAPDRLDAEQYVDFIVGRHFRRSILCHAELSPRAEPDSEPIEAFHISSTLSPGSEDGDDDSPEGKRTFVAPNGSSVVTSQPLLIAALERLWEVSNQSLPFSDLLFFSRSQSRFLRDEDADRDSLARLLLSCYCEGCVELAPRRRPFETEPRDRPTAAPLALNQARNGLLALTNQLHQTIWVEEHIRDLAALLDGSRTREELANDEGLQLLARSALLVG